MSGAAEFMMSRGKWGMKLGLERMTALLEALGNPEQALRIIHVAGSNGKGSVCRMLEAVLKDAGYITGAYTSPALERFNERIRLSGTDISDTALEAVYEQVRSACEALSANGLEYPTGFEMETAAALLYFQKCGCDFVVLEVGLGGRLDATNAIPPALVSVITGISLEHTQWLGSTVEAVAAEKAGIIKAGTHVVCAPEDKAVREVITSAAAAAGAADIMYPEARAIACLSENVRSQTLCVTENPIRRSLAPTPTPEAGLCHEPFTLGLGGMYQQKNCLTALCALDRLACCGADIPVEAIRSGMARAKNPGRFETLQTNPAIILDGAHNPEGIAAFVQNIRHFYPHKKITLFFGMLGDKDVHTSLKSLLPLCERVWTLTPENPEALRAEESAALVSALSDVPVQALSDWSEVTDCIDLSDEDAVYACTGSLYMIGHLRGLLRSFLNKTYE